MKAKKVIAMILTCAAISSITACGTGKSTEVQNQETKVQEEVEEEDPEAATKEEVEGAIQEFEYACQSSDVDAMLECLDAGFAQTLKSERLLLNWMSSKKNYDEVVMNTMLISLLNIPDITVDLSTMDIEISDIEIADNAATAKITWNMSCSSGDYKEDASMHMSKSGDKWYITGIES